MSLVRGGTVRVNAAMSNLVTQERVYSSDGATLMYGKNQRVRQQDVDGLRKRGVGLVDIVAQGRPDVVKVERRTKVEEVEVPVVEEDDKTPDAPESDAAKPEVEEAKEVAPSVEAAKAPAKKPAAKKPAAKKPAAAKKPVGGNTAALNRKERPAGTRSAGGRVAKPKTS